MAGHGARGIQLFKDHYSRCMPVQQSQNILQKMCDCLIIVTELLLAYKQFLYLGLWGCVGFYFVCLFV